MYRNKLKMAYAHILTNMHCFNATWTFGLQSCLWWCDSSYPLHPYITYLEAQLLKQHTAHYSQCRPTVLDIVAGRIYSILDNKNKSLQQGQEKVSVNVSLCVTLQQVFIPYASTPGNYRDVLLLYASYASIRDMYAYAHKHLHIHNRSTSQGARQHVMKAVSPQQATSGSLEKRSSYFILPLVWCHA